MTTPTLPFQIDQVGYTVQDGTKVASVQLDGGAGRYRRDQQGASSMVTGQLTLNVAEYGQWRDFLNNTIADGSLPFFAQLVIDEGETTQNLCYIVPGTVQLVSQTGQTYVVQFTLEATSITPQTVFFGFVSSMTPNSTQVQALATSQKTSFVGNYTLAKDSGKNYMCLAFPASFGTPSQIIINNFNYIFDTHTLTINSVVYNLFLNSYSTTATSVPIQVS